jgi:transcriptional regulator with XRE-family HTH domain
MSTSSSSSARAARQHLADQLREMRQEAGLSGVDFASRAGWRDSSQVTRIERGQRTISAAHVRLWCRICGASPHETDCLLAEQANVAAMWLANRQLRRGGLRRLQTEDRDDYASRQIRFYASKGIPGLLQIQPYAAHALRSIRMEFGMDLDDVAEAAAARMERNTVLRGPGRFAFVLEQEVLWHRTCPLKIHRDQLEHLLAATRLPSVSLGIIPWERKRDVAGYGVWPDESFVIFGNQLVSVELVSGNMSFTRPDEVTAYARSWDRLSQLSVVGDPARAVIHAAMKVLEDQDS